VSASPEAIPFSQSAELEHLSEFRVGSSLLLITILPKHKMDNP